MEDTALIVPDHIYCKLKATTLDSQPLHHEKYHQPQQRNKGQLWSPHPHGNFSKNSDFGISHLAETEQSHKTRLQHNIETIVCQRVSVEN